MIAIIITCEWCSKKYGKHMRCLALYFARDCGWLFFKFCNEILRLLNSIPHVFQTTGLNDAHNIGVNEDQMNREWFTSVLTRTSLSTLINALPCLVSRRNKIQRCPLWVAFLSQVRVPSSELRLRSHPTPFLFAFIFIFRPFLCR